MDRRALSYWESGFAGPVRPMSAPIIPAAGDTAFIRDRMLAFARGRPVDAVVLGLTRSLVTLPWPAGSSLLAVEWSSTMIRRFWSRDGVPAAAWVARADWRELPLASSSCDVAAGDGCWTALPSLADIAVAHSELARVLRPDGLLCMRCFARPERGLTVDAILDALHGGTIASVFLLQWLLAMSAHGDSRDGVALDTVWRAWTKAVPQPGVLFERHGWPEDSAWTFERWKGVLVRYSFPTLGELEAAAAPLFEVVERRVPDYPWGECFPTVVMRPRK